MGLCLDLTDGELPLAVTIRAMSERRRSPRIAGPFDARWSGSAGGPCRLPDISLTGCYVSSLTSQPVGSEVTITLTTDAGTPLSLTGKVVSVDAGLGFGVEFVRLTDADLQQLQAWLDARRR